MQFSENGGKPVFRPGGPRAYDLLQASGGVLKEQWRDGAGTVHAAGCPALCTRLRPWRLAA